MKLTIFFKQVLARISYKLNIKVIFYYYFRKKIDLSGDPNKLKTLDAKIQWLKVNKYGKQPIYTQCADKYLVREYVRSRGCQEILNGLIGVYDNVGDINWESLPDSFVLKWNFGNGFNIICPDKSKLDICSVTKQLRKWGKYSAHLTHSELQYKNIPKKIICEKYLKPKNGLVPEDYKVYCFNGKVKYTLVCVGRDQGWPKFYFLDKDWSLARINKDSKDAPEGFTIAKPSCLDFLYEYAEKLSEPFDFVRADFYLVDDKVYFGELTFSPSGGFDVNRYRETDKLLGSLISIKI